MKSIGHLLPGTHRWVSDGINAWDRFWFTPRLPHTLGVLRILTGAMLLYSHFVLATDLMSFVGDGAWIDNVTSRGLHDGAFGFSDWGRTYLWYLSNPLLLWLHHFLTIAVTLCFAAGLLTRFTAPAAWFLQVMYLHRLTGSLFGLDQIVTYAAMYLMLAPCGSCLSVDAWIRGRLGEKWASDRRLRWIFPQATPSVAANVATRLFQIHLCVIYLFGGLAKARGSLWWDGTAIWYSAGNLEYQSWDLTWVRNFPRIASALSHATLFWELSYAALIWPRLTRPIMLAMAVAIHGGIAIFLGMITFGTMMIVANLIFFRPEFLLGIVGKMRADEVFADEELADLDDDEWDEIELSIDTEAGKSSIGLGSSIDGLGSSGDGLGDSGSTIGSSLDARSEKLDRYERKLRRAAKQLQQRSDRIKGNEVKYRERVSKLKQREAKIKDLVERRRAKGKDT